MRQAYRAGRIRSRTRERSSLRRHTLLFAHRQKHSRVNLPVGKYTRAGSAFPFLPPRCAICTNTCVDSSQCFSSSGGEHVLSVSWCVGVDGAGNVVPESADHRCVQLCDSERSPPCAADQECISTNYDGVDQSFCVPMPQ